MRQVGAVLFALFVAAIVVAAELFLDLGVPVIGESIWSILATSAVAAALAYGGVAMSPEIMQVREFLKQLAVWLAIVSLLPLSVRYGTSVIHPPPDEDKYQKARNDISERRVEAEDDAAKEKELLKEEHALEEEHEAASAAFNRMLFWVAYPLGLVALVLGSFLTIQSVGSALMFGGLSTLTVGCYSYWDKMDSSLRFYSLVIALAVVLAIGIWRFRSSSDRALLAVRPAE